jgi:hypothetical protein
MTAWVAGNCTVTILEAALPAMLLATTWTSHDAPDGVKLETV